MAMTLSEVKLFTNGVICSCWPYLMTQMMEIFRYFEAFYNIVLMLYEKIGTLLSFKRGQKFGISKLEDFCC
jgi:hypothetical protein